MQTFCSSELCGETGVPNVRVNSRVGDGADVL